MRQSAVERGESGSAALGRCTSGRHEVDTGRTQMNSIRFVLAIVLTLAACLVLLAGCASGPASEIPNPFAALFQGSKAEQALSAGIKQFEEGEYAAATKSLHSALDFGLAGDSDQIKAHKYLAFIHCATGRTAHPGASARAGTSSARRSRSIHRWSLNHRKEGIRSGARNSAKPRNESNK